MTVYQDMNNKIVDLLRMGDTPVELYAAQRIEELELKNKELIDHVLEIIDKYDTDKYDTSVRFRVNPLASVRDEVKDLKGEQE